jgi:hypothetical protein
MSLGTRLGPYAITAPLRAGGMGKRSQRGLSCPAYQMANGSWSKIANRASQQLSRLPLFAFVSHLVASTNAGHRSEGAFDVSGASGYPEKVTDFAWQGGALCWWGSHRKAGTGGTA